MYNDFHCRLSLPSQNRWTYLRTAITWTCISWATDTDKGSDSTFISHSYSTHAKDTGHKVRIFHYLPPICKGWKKQKFRIVTLVRTFLCEVPGVFSQIISLKPWNFNLYYSTDTFTYKKKANITPMEKHGHTI